MEAFSIAELVSFLETECPDIESDTLNLIKTNKISGKRAMKLTMQDWSNIGISYGETVDIKGAIDEYLSGAGRHNVNRDDSSSNVYDVETNTFRNISANTAPGSDSDDSGGNAENEADGDRFASVRGFFPQDEFEAMSSYRKESILSQFDVYQAAVKIKCNIAAPAFMNLQSEDQTRNCPMAKSKTTTASKQNESTTVLRQTRLSTKDKQIASSNASKSLEVNCGASTSKAMAAGASSSGQKRKTNADPIEFNNFSDPCNSDPPSGNEGVIGSEQLANNEHQKSSKRRKRVKRKTRPEDRLSEEEFAASLPKFDIFDILTEAGRKLKPVKALLEKDGIVYGKERKLLMRTLTKHIYYKHVTDIKLVTTDMKSGMASSLVSTFPRFKDTTDPTKRSWWRVFDPSGPSGFIANCVAGILRALDPQDRPRGGGRGASYLSEDEEEDENDGTEDKENAGPADNHPEADWMKLTMPWDTNKRKLEQGMEQSFESRRQWICKKQPSITEILTLYPHLMSYDCEFMEKEFDMIHPNKGHLFSKTFPHLVQSVKGRDDLHEVESLDDGANTDMLGACLALGTALPRQNLQKRARKKKSGSEESVIPSLSTLVTMVPLGTNVQDVVDKRRKSSSSPVQPYLLALVPQKQITKLFVIADSKMIQVASPSLLKGLDMLFKSYTVFNVMYPLGWSAFWEMIEHGIYQIAPSKLSNSALEVLRLHNIVK